MNELSRIVQPYFTEFVDVCPNHRLYVERYGRKGGVPILFLHGGPGAGCSRRDKMFFDPTRDDVLFVDQRGAGRSTATDLLIDNTTPDLIADLVLLLDRYNIRQTSIFGGSWGATLAMLFAINFPERVSKLILRGLFFADSQAIRYTLEGGRKVRPEVYERFYSLTPQADWSCIAGLYLSGMREGTSTQRQRFINEWARFELSLGSLTYNSSIVELMVSNNSFYQFSTIGAHYFANNFFFESGFIFANADSLKDRAISMVHGKYDLVASIERVQRLAGQLCGATLYETLEGHSGFEPETFNRLCSELAKLECL